MRRVYGSASSWWGIRRQTSWALLATLVPFLEAYSQAMGNTAFYFVYATGDTLDLHEVTVNDGIRVLHTIAVRSGGLRQEIAYLNGFLFKYLPLELPPAGVHPSLPFFPTKTTTTNHLQDT
jgi:hypothetical protein